MIATPSWALGMLQAKVRYNIEFTFICVHFGVSGYFSRLDSLIIDEADLIISYGHDKDIRQIFSRNFLQKIFQSFLTSATMTKNVEILKGLALRNPVSQLYHGASIFPQHITEGHSQTSERRRASMSYAVKCVCLFDNVPLIFYLTSCTQMFQSGQIPLVRPSPSSHDLHTLFHFLNRSISAWINTAHSCMLSVSNRSKFREPPGKCWDARRRIEAYNNSPESPFPGGWWFWASRSRTSRVNAQLRLMLGRHH